MGLFREFLTWRKDQKRRKQLNGHWTDPYAYENNPPIANRTCYSLTNHSFRMYDTDEAYLRSLLDAYGPRSKPQFPFKITADNNSMTRPEFESAME